MALVNWPNINMQFFRRLPTHNYCSGSGVLMRGSHPPGSAPPPYSHYPVPRLLMPDLAPPPGPLSSPPPGPVATTTSPAALDSRYFRHTVRRFDTNC